MRSCCRWSGNLRRAGWDDDEGKRVGDETRQGGGPEVWDKLGGVEWVGLGPGEVPTEHTMHEKQTELSWEIFHSAASEVPEMLPNRPPPTDNSPLPTPLHCTALHSIPCRSSARNVFQNGITHTKHFSSCHTQAYLRVKCFTKQ